MDDADGPKPNGQEQRPQTQEQRGASFKDPGKYDDVAAQLHAASLCPERHRTATKSQARQHPQQQGRDPMRRSHLPVEDQKRAVGWLIARWLHQTSCSHGKKQPGWKRTYQAEISRLVGPMLHFKASRHERVNTLAHGLREHIQNVPRGEETRP